MSEDQQQGEQTSTSIEKIINPEMIQAGESKLKIGQLLVKHTSLTEDQLNEALDIQKSESGLLGLIL